MNQGTKIHLLITGGTIDSFYNGIKDTVECLEHSVIPDYLKSIKMPFEIETTEICMKDSRQITNKDRESLLEKISNSKAENILITHGTYTLPDTARYLEANMERKDRKIILTGSMIPLPGFSPSDAGFNLGFAIASFQNIQSGVYVAMNGRLLKANEAIKLISEGKFDSVFNKN